MVDYFNVPMQDLTDLEGRKGDSEPIQAWGSLSVMTRPAIGVCGSRHASEKGLEYAYELGRIAASQGVTVVSGYAAGVDLQAHLGALVGGGGTVAVLPEGFDHFSVRMRLRNHVRQDNFLAISCYPAKARWTVWRAMERNRTILALVDAMFVVEAGDSGGTLAAGVDALKSGTPLFVLDRPNTEGNQILVRREAVRVRTMRELKNAILGVAKGSTKKRTLFTGG